MYHRVKQWNYATEQFMAVFSYNTTHILRGDSESLWPQGYNMRGQRGAALGGLFNHVKGTVMET